MLFRSYQADTYIPNKIYFTAISNTPLADQVWTITKLPASTTTPPVSLHQNNPSFVFTDTGYYNVCLRAVTTGGCVKEYCRIIHIEHVVITPGTCTLPLYPNPVTDVVNVTLNLNADQMIDAYIYNNMAVLVREKHQAGFTGNNTVSINVGDLPAGSYTIRVVHGNDVCYAQFIKL